MEVKEKTCTECGKTKKLSEFGKETKGKFGVRSKCLECTKILRKKYYEEHKDKEKSYYKKYYEENLGKEQARSERYRKLNKEKVKETQRKYRENNPEKVREQNKKWAQENKDLVNFYSKCHRDSRREFLDKIKMEQGCSICGYNEHPRALQFDHLDPKDKSFTISSYLTCAISKLLEELSKCRVLCANCHSIHTWNEQHWKNRKDKENSRIEITIIPIEE